LQSQGGAFVVLPFMVLIGFSIVMAEPAVQVLVQKVYEISGGTIGKKVMFLAIMVSMALAMLLNVIKVIYEIPFIYIIVPLYILIVALTFVTPRLFVAIAFDSGGVASGPMTNNFVLPFIFGVTFALGQTNAVGAFGTIALISAMPLLTIQVIGLMLKVYKLRQQKKIIPVKKSKVKVEILEFSE
jgi:hypothetical protein